LVNLHFWKTILEGVQVAMGSYIGQGKGLGMRVTGAKGIYVQENQ